MSTPENRRPANDGTSVAVLAHMQAAMAEIGHQRDSAQARAVEVAILLAAARARIAALESEIVRFAAAEKEWRALADAPKTSESKPPPSSNH